MFTSFYFANYTPLSLLSLSVDNALWGLDPFGYHLTNILLHPLRVQSVAWVAERRDILSGFFSWPRF